MQKVLLTCDQCQAQTTEPKNWWAIFSTNGHGGADAVTIRPWDHGSQTAMHACSVECLQGSVKAYAEDTISKLVKNKLMGMDAKQAEESGYNAPGEISAKEYIKAKALAEIQAQIEKMVQPPSSKGTLPMIGIPTLGKDTL